MSVPGFESDRFAIMALDLETGESREVAPDWDRSASPLGLSDDGKTLYTSADNEGSHALFAIDVDSGEVAPLVDSGSVTGFDVAGNSTVVGHQDLQHPTDLYRLDDGNLQRLTRFNSERLQGIEFGESDWFWFKRSEERRVGDECRSEWHWSTRNK